MKDNIICRLSSLPVAIVLLFSATSYVPGWAQENAPEPLESLYDSVPALAHKKHQEPANTQKLLATNEALETMRRVDRIDSAVRSKPVDQKRILTVVNGLRDQSSTVRFVAALAFRQMMPEGQPALPFLHKALIEDTDAQVRNCAAIALAYIGPQRKDSIDALIMALSDPSPHVRNTVLFALEMYGKAAAPAIDKLRYVQSHDTDVSARNVARALVQRLESPPLLP
jgi:hypothetical protein